MSGSASQKFGFTYPVVVGSSTEDIDALSRLVATLPEDFDAPVVIAQHLDPQSESHLAAIPARRSTLPLQTVEDAVPLVAGVGFVVPVNRHVRIDDHEISLTRDSDERPMPSVDRLMESPANIFGERCAYEARGCPIGDGDADGGVVVFRKLSNDAVQR